jgi:hypothetical protein
MSGYDYFKQQQQHHHQRGSGGGGGGRSTNTSPIQYGASGGSLDYDPLELHTTAAALQQQQQHHQHLALLAMPLANYPNLFAFAPPPPLPDHHHHHQLHLPSLLGAATTNNAAAGTTTTTTNNNRHHHHHHHHQRHDSFDDLAGMVHQPQLDWSAALPVPAPVVTTSSAAAAAIFPLSAAMSSSSALLAASFTELSHHERWLAELQLDVKDISVDPLSGTAVLHRLREKLDDVLHKYIPCVSFLVDCQQTLRKGLERRRISAPQYYRLYVDHLPGEFCRKNIQMDGNTLTEAYNGLLQLRSEAANAQTQGSEAVKSNFLGGMKDGESWGLRKWLSRHGGALHVCTDVECIVSVCRKLDDQILQRMSQILRPAGKTVLHKLQTEIPTSYQAHSTAHPYLPYFHRLEAALRNLSTLGEANDIICLDDDDDDDDSDDVQLIVPHKKTAPTSSHKPPPAIVRKPAAAAAIPAAVVAVPQQQQHKRSRVHAFADDYDDDDVDNGSLDTKPPARKTAKQPVFIKQDEDEEDDDADNNNNNNNVNGDNDDDGSSSGESCDDAVEVIDNNPWPFQPLTDSGLVRRLVTQVYQLAEAWDGNQLMRPPHVHASPFWRGNRFAEALRLFADLLDARQQATMSFLAEPTDDNACVKAGQPPFSHVVKHPIAFRCIVNSLLDRSGSLPDKTLSSWNMFDGKDMLQAIDLVLLNSLAYGKMVNAETSVRQEINVLRKLLWAGIQKIGARKTDLPTRRMETSGFVVYRDHHSPNGRSR